MSNTPFFDALLAEYDEKKRDEILKTLSTPFMSTVKPVLPKRNVAQLISVPTPNPEFAKQIQEFIQTAPMKILAGTPAGSFISSMETVRTGDGGLVIEAEVTVPTTDAEYAQKDAADTMAMFQGARPKLAWVDEWQTSDPDEDEIYIAPAKTSEPLVIAEHKTQTVPEDLARKQLGAYRSASPFFRQKAAQHYEKYCEAVESMRRTYDDRFTPPMSEKTMPSWIADEVQESNERLSDPEPVENVVGIAENVSLLDIEKEEGGLPVFFKNLVARFRKDYPDADNMSIHRKEEVDGTITISVTGTTPEQTDESVNAASKNESKSATVKPLWDTNEE